jgi:hypothetical protein
LQQDDLIYNAIVQYTDSAQMPSIQSIRRVPLRDLLHMDDLFAEQ